MEASVFLEKALFSSFTYNAPPSSEEDDHEPPVFEINLNSLLETLGIFSLSDPNTSKRSGDYDSFAAHRLNRHAGTNNFSNQPLGVTGVCTLSYDGDGSPLSIHMSEAGVTTTCELTTYEAEVSEDIPFDRESLALKTIMKASHLLEAVAELSSMSPDNLVMTASPMARAGAHLSLSASGPLGSATVDFSNEPASDVPILETFQCPARTTACFKFGLIRHAQRAIATASKISLRLDGEGVMSLQCLVEIDTGGSSDGVAFVDFRMVPLMEGEDDDYGEEDDTDDEQGSVINTSER